jgi:hypothetical protein
MQAITPEPILKIATGFMAAKQLFAASEIGLFEALADRLAWRSSRARPRFRSARWEL